MIPPSADGVAGPFVGVITVLAVPHSFQKPGSEPKSITTEIRMFPPLRCSGKS